MRRLVSALSLLLVGLSVAAADDGAAPETFDRYAYRLLVTRPLVPAAELGGYEAFRLAITRRKGDSHVEMEALSAFQSKIFGSTGPHLAHFKEEQEHFGSGESQVTYADAIADWEELAQGGNPEAMGNLGVIYDLGLGVVPNPARAVELYRAASDRGWPEAQMNLGIAYALGRGVERSESQAVRWLRAASENGSALAPNTLGVLHLIAGDERSAIMELSRAVARRYAIASRNLERLFEKMADDPEFEDWYWNTAVPQATGWSPVPDEPVAAYNWFDRAADRGFPAAARKRALAEAAKKASTTRWVMSFFSAPEHELREEEEIIAKIGRGLCRVYAENNFGRFQKILANSSQRYMGRELRLSRAYRYLRCYQPGIGDVDLIRVSAENPMVSDKSLLELIYYFVNEAEDKFLLGNILMCRRDFGSACMNVFEHIERNLEDSERRNRPFVAKALNDVKRLLYNNLDENHLTYDRGFCRTYFPEQPEQCHN